MDKILESLPMNEKHNEVSNLVTKVIKGRRSIYADEFTGEPISDELLWEILTNATWAPTHKMTEPWRFVVFKGKYIREYGRFMAEFYKDHYQSLLNENDFLTKCSYLQAYPTKAACLVGLVLVRNTKIGLPEWEEIAALSCAVQNMALTCEANGLGGYWGTSEAAIKYVSQTGIRENEQSLGIFYIGWPHENSLKSKKKRSPIENKVEILL